MLRAGTVGLSKIVVYIVTFWDVWVGIKNYGPNFYQVPVLLITIFLEILIVKIFGCHVMHEIKHTKYFLLPVGIYSFYCTQCTCVGHNHVFCT